MSYWLCRDSWPSSHLSPLIEGDNLGQLTIGVEFCVSLERERLYSFIKPLLDRGTHTSQLHFRQFVLPPSSLSLLVMSAPLPSATALMNHADDPRHIIYSTWIIPHFFPYMRDLLCGVPHCICVTALVYRSSFVHRNELTKQPAHATFARGLLDAVFAPPSNTGCPCVTLAVNLRSVFKAYGEGGISIRDNQAWSAVSVAMIYFILTTDFYFAAPMTAPMKANHLAQLRVLNFSGPKFPAKLLQ